MRIAILADTHLPKGTRRLPDSCIEHLKSADLILHAGDFVRVSVLEELRSYCQVIAVHGNVDEYDLQTELPAATQLTDDGTTIALIHDAGPAPGRLARLRRRFPDADAVIFGHSHIPLHDADPQGFQIFNPGSPTERRRSPRHTMGLARVENGSVTFELIELG
jgi:uncharacterized protein